jgi:hypothetical protein
MKAGVLGVLLLTLATFAGEPSGAGAQSGVHVTARPQMPDASGSASATSALRGVATGSVAQHVETWAYDDGCNGGTGASATLVREWVSYAEQNCGPRITKTASDCHAGGVTYCKDLEYADTSIVFTSGPETPILSSASDGWFLHQPSPNQNRRLEQPGGSAYYLNQTVPAVKSWWDSYLQSSFSSVDGLLLDDQSPSLLQGLSYTSCGCTSSAEITTDAAYRAAHERMSAGLTHPGGGPYTEVDNTISQGNPNLPQGLHMLQGSVGGLLAEGVPERDGRLSRFYPGLLDDIAYVDNNTSSFLVFLSYGASGASYQARSRRVQEATDLLGYKAGQLVDWADLEQGSSNLAVWPEEGIYPTGPVQSMGAPTGRGCLTATGTYCPTGGHNDLVVALGVYRREFSSCYDQGVRIGPCAALVNDTGSAVTIAASWLTQSYTNRVTFSGGDVQAAGTISLTGASFAPGSTTIPADDATLLTNPGLGVVKQVARHALARRLLALRARAHSFDWLLVLSGLILLVALAGLLFVRRGR